MVSYIPLISSLGALIAGTLTLRVFQRRREKTFLVATASMYLFFFGAFLEFISSYLGYWPEILYRLYYGTSPIQPALLASAILGIYTLDEFIRHKKIYKGYLLYTGILGSLVLILSLIAEVNTTLLSDPYVGGAAMASYVRILSPPLTIPSGIILIGYPLYTWIKGTKHIDKIMFPTAALIVMIGGAAIRMGWVSLFYMFELGGAIVLLMAFYTVYKRYVQ